jgi:S1-C subfamily serine protease
VRAQVMNASHYEDLKLVITGAGGPGDDDLGHVTPQMLSSAGVGEVDGDNLGVSGLDLSGRVGDQEPGIIAISETEEPGDELSTQYGMTDALPVTGPPAGKGGLPIKLGGGPGKVIVKAVRPGSRVANAGLAVGDRVISVDGRKVTAPVQAQAALSGPIGSVVMLEVEHDGERFNVVVQRERVLAGD